MTEEQVTDWIARAEVFYGRFLDPARYGKPKDSHGNGMYAADAKRWALRTPEEKRAQAVMNLGPHFPDKTNAVYCVNVQNERTDFNHAMGRHRVLQQ